jgi:serine/threonine protein kinase/Tol biopolymer transport system component
MNSGNWQRVDRLFQAALEIDPRERRAYLEQNCSGDDSLRREVESLLEYDQQGLSLIDVPAFEMFANLVGTDAPELSVGQLIGHYEILNVLGKGGMGEVYLAQDTRLGRKVALKLLPADFTTDDERVRRFQKEARAATALNHPNILTIYEIGQFESRRFMATEFIEGRTLRQLAKGSRLSLIDALDMAAQIASALAAAHQAGIVHRDIKPENIMRRPDGYVKVLDFGLAKLTESGTANGVTQARTLEQNDTQPGMVLGTAKYMSPEQARGVTVDGRSDIFSLGVLIYEMVTGRTPFEGDTTSDLIASILRVDPPPLADHWPDAPDELQRIISKALNKDPGDRYQTAGVMLVDLRSLRQELELESKIQRAIQSGSDSGTTVTTSATRINAQTADALALATGSAGTVRTLSSPRYLITQINRNKARAAAICVILIAVIGSGYWGLKSIGWGKSAHFQNIQMSGITTSGKAEGAAISPDGKYVAYAEYDGKQQNLWIRQLAAASNTLVASSTNIGSGLTFSPDGNYLYYVSQAALYQIPALGGVAQKLITGVNSLAAAISSDGRRLAFVRDYGPEETAIVVANADGTDERKIATRRSPEMFSSAAWSPDGKKLICVVQGRDGDGFYADLVEMGVEGAEQMALTDRRWASINDVVWLSDASGLMMTANEKSDGSYLLWRISYPGGEARRITTDLTNYSGLSMTRDSSAIVSTQKIGVYNLYRLTDGDTGGATQLTSGSGRSDGWSGISWTPDGKIVYSSAANGTPEIWTMEPDGSNQKQLTVDLGSSGRGLSVSPDGRYIVLVSDRAGGPQVWRIDIDGGNPNQLTFSAGAFRNPFFSPDGKWVFCFDGADRPRASKVPTDGGEPVQLTGPHSEIVPRGFSPDGELIAYKPPDVPIGAPKLGIASSESGEPIKILNLPRNIQWTPDGQSITYVDGRSGARNLWLQPLDGAPPKQLTNFKEKDFSIHYFAWSPDGKYLVFSRGFSTSNTVLIKSVE